MLRAHRVSAAALVRRPARLAQQRWNSNTPNPSPWGLSPQYARVLSRLRVKQLPDVTPLGVLSLPPWQRNRETQIARSYVDAISTPRDEYVLEIIAGILLGPEDRAAAAAAAGRSAEDEAAQRSTRRRRSRAPAAAAAAAANKAAAEPATGEREGEGEVGGDVVEPDAVGKRTQLLDAPSRTLQRLLEASKAAFLALAEEGLPHVHRPVRKDDGELVHDQLLSRWEQWRARADMQHASSSKSSNNNSGNSGNSSTTQHSSSSGVLPGIRIESIEAAKIVDMYTVYDATLRPEDWSEGGAWVREAGHSAVIRSVGDDGGFLFRFLQRFAHYYGLTPWRRIHGQFTVAYLCRETQTGIDSSSSESTTGSSSSGNGNSASDSNGKGNRPLTVHTVTYEGAVATTWEPPHPVLRFFLPQVVAPEQGWKVVDVDGWAVSDGFPDLTTSSMLQRARQMAVSTAAAEAVEMVDAVRGRAPLYRQIAAGGAALDRGATALVAALHATPAGRRMLDQQSKLLQDARLGDVAAASLVTCRALYVAADALAVVDSRPPWVSRLERQAAEEAAGRVITSAAVSAGFASLPLSGVKPFSVPLPPSPTSDSEAGDATVSRLVAAAGGDMQSWLARAQGMSMGKALRTLDAAFPRSPWGLQMYLLLRAKAGQMAGEVTGLEADAEVLYFFSPRSSLVLCTALTYELRQLKALPAATPAGNGTSSSSDSKDDSKSDSHDSRDSRVQGVREADAVRAALDAIATDASVLAQADPGLPYASGFGSASSAAGSLAPPFEKHSSSKASKDTATTKGQTDEEEEEKEGDKYSKKGQKGDKAAASSSKGSKSAAGEEAGSDNDNDDDDDEDDEEHAAHAAGGEGDGEEVDVSREARQRYLDGVADIQRRLLAVVHTMAASGWLDAADSPVQEEKQMEKEVEEKEKEKE